MSLYGNHYHTVNVGRDVYEVDVRYTDLKAVGAGAYGIVCSAQDNKTGKKVAIKKITDPFLDLVDAKRILREIRLLRHLGAHENIIRILDIMTMPPNCVDFDDIYIVTELMESDLERIITSKQNLTDAHFQYFLYQILRGCKYIHSANVLHRDLKPSNLLVNGNCELAVCDFGLSRGVTTCEEDLTEYVVTRWYRAPELLTDCINYGPAVDVWAIGCIFAELLLRKPFFQGNDPNHQLLQILQKLGSPDEEGLQFITHVAARKAIVRHGFFPKKDLATFFPDCEPLAVDLLTKMLAFSPEDRIPVEEALQHPYLKALHNAADEPDCISPFNFDFEREALDQGVDIPKAELQQLIYDDMKSFRP